MSKFDVFYIVNETEFLTPLVSSQVFEQAEIQFQVNHGEELGKVKVIVPVSLRNYWDKTFRIYLQNLKNRFPNIEIVFIPGIGRLKYFPRKFLYKSLRKASNSTSVIWHFRGDSLVSELSIIKKSFPTDKFVIDIRGIWPAEKLLDQGIEVLEESQLYDFEISKALIDDLKSNLKYADAVCSVSQKLLSWTLNLVEYKIPGWVVPCSTKISTNDLDYFLKHKEGFEFLESKLTIGYLGGTAKYQNLDELVIPFMKNLVEKDERVFLLIISHQKDEFLKKLRFAKINEDKFLIISSPQSTVIDFVKMLDLGLLIRKYNVVNAMAQPVKLGEYLAASVPVLIEKKIGGIAELENEQKALLRFSFKDDNLEELADACLNYLKNTSRHERKLNALNLASNYFSWENNVNTQFTNYLKII